MERLTCVPREDWKRKLEAHGFSFHSADGEYWNESAYYRFSSAEIDRLEDATNALHRLCMEAVDRIVRSGRYEPFELQPAVANWIQNSWNRRDPYLYGRFDLAYDGVDSIKMLEYNADTPTSLIESSLSQWFWLEEAHPAADQFNSIHEKLIARWSSIASDRPDKTLHLSSMSAHIEDGANTSYLQDCAIQAGISTHRVDIQDIGWSTDQNRLVDLSEVPIQWLFKLYPLEWLIRDRFGDHLLKSDIQLIEPPWKWLLSSKAILPLLWEYFPNNPYLLPAFFGDPPPAGNWARKPIYSREGANIALIENGQVTTETKGHYQKYPVVSQQLAPVFQSDGRYSIIGSWMVGDEASGIGIREDAQRITRNSSLFVPHLFD